MKNMLKKGLLVSSLALAGISSQAIAATATANFTVTATVNASCVVSASNVAFGAITPAATGDASATGTITSTCSNGTGYTLTLAKGNGTSISDRSMGGAAGNTDRLKYNIYTDSAKTQVFGDTTPGTLTGTGTGVAQAVTVYGKLALNQYIKADSYSDSLTVTLTY